VPAYSLEGLVPVVDPSAFVHPQAVLIGDVIIGAHCYVGPMASLRGDFGRIVLQAGANVQDCCVLHSFPDKDALLEEEAHIGHAAVLHGCTIRRGALVGIAAVIMDGAVVEEQAFVGASSFVRAWCASSRAKSSPGRSPARASIRTSRCAA
jgi:phenylacetic acid degradation protein